MEKVYIELRTDPYAEVLRRGHFSESHNAWIDKPRSKWEGLVLHLYEMRQQIENQLLRAEP